MNKQDKRELILNGNLLTVIVTLALPIVLNSFIQTMYNLTDTYWISNLGPNEMAAITIATPVQNIILNFGTGITTAGSILIAQFLGAKEDHEANIMARHIFMCSIIFSVVCAAICFILTPTIINALGARDDVYTYACTYLQVVILDMPLLFTINMFTAVYQSQGETIKPMLLNLLGVIINLILDPLLIATFNMGVFGAAIATLVAKIPGALIALFILFDKKRTIFLAYKNFKFEKSKFTSILQVGLPTAIGSSTMQFGFLLMSTNVLKYGSTAVAAYGIGNKINGLISLPSNAMGSATATIVGQNIGAKQKDRAEQGYLLAMKIAVVFLFVSGFILSRKFIARPIVSIFSDQEEVIYHATNFLSLMAMCCWTNGIYNATIGLFQGSGHTMITMAVDASRIWVFRFLTLFICEEILKMGVESIWYSVVISNATSSLILFILYKLHILKKDVVKLKKS